MCPPVRMRSRLDFEISFAIWQVDCHISFEHGGRGRNDVSEKERKRGRK